MCLIFTSYYLHKIENWLGLSWGLIVGPGSVKTWLQPGSFFQSLTWATSEATNLAKTQCVVLWKCAYCRASHIIGEIIWLNILQKTPAEDAPLIDPVLWCPLSAEKPQSSHTPCYKTIRKKCFVAVLLVLRVGKLVSETKNIVPGCTCIIFIANTEHFNISLWSLLSSSGH